MSDDKHPSMQPHGGGPGLPSVYFCIRCKGLVPENAPCPHCSPAPSVGSPSASAIDRIAAAYSADWQQVVGNGGPPCFHIDLQRDGRRFCLRAERWAGHTDKDEYPEHRFVCFGDLMRWSTAAEAERDSLKAQLAQLDEAEALQLRLPWTHGRIARAHVEGRREGIEAVAKKCEFLAGRIYLDEIRALLAEPQCPWSTWEVGVEVPGACTCGQHRAEPLKGEK